MRPPVSPRAVARATLACVLLVGAAPAAAAPAAPAAPSPADDPVGVWPLDPPPPVVARFSPPDGPYGAGHRGVDLLGSVGQPVRSALPGTVTFTGSIAGVGVVVVGHGATRTTYQPVAASVVVGAVVDAGTPVGALQAGGTHCPPRTCLHWGWVVGETYLDPLRLVGAGPVRLLPLWSSVAAPALVPRSLRLGDLARTPLAALVPPAGGGAPGAGRLTGFRPGGGPGGRPSAAGRW